MSFTINTDVEYVALTCATCGCIFALTEHFQRQRRQDHKDFFCPNGHTNVFPHKTDAERLREEKGEADPPARPGACGEGDAGAQAGPRREGHLPALPPVVRQPRAPHEGEARQGVREVIREAGRGGSER